jgi:uncharacterized membrane protein YjfL (UPF0719 family)
MQHTILNTLAFFGLGAVMFIIIIFLAEKLTPKHNLAHEILEKKNTALAIVIGSFMIALAIIIAAAIHE